MQHMPFTLRGRLRVSIVPPVFLFVVIVFAIINFFYGPFGYTDPATEVTAKGTMDYLYLVIAGFHLIFGVALLFQTGLQRILKLYRTPEFLFAVTLIVFLFSFIFALNANMDYIQRFAASSGNIRLAPDSTIQRLNSFARFLPLLTADGLFIIFYRLKYRSLTRRILGSTHFAGMWALWLTLGSAFLYTVSLPSFVTIHGIAPLAYVCLVPLILAFRYSSYRWSVFYGVTFGVIQTMLCNFWLGTFSLISLQFITVYYLIIYTLFMVLALWIVKRNWDLMFITLPALWVVFDYLRSVGFMGYPWAMLGTSQYGFLPLIQISSLTGVWGVTFIVVLANTAIAELLKKRKRSPGWQMPVLTFLIFFSASVLYGEIAFLIERNREPVKQVRIALIQQNTDPRKDDYRDSFEVLRFLTDKAMAERPDLVAWSETAFVVNIRKWSKLDPEKYGYARLVHDFLAYQKSLETWLITGNDDYMTVTTDIGEERVDYNASILFSPQGERIETYHKLHLVPFTEYFPYKEQFPGFYNLLLDFDVNLWEPGTEPVVFEHPEFTFSTPICFEDSFPGDIRRFVINGAEVILNLSNDFWSLTTVEAKQHFVNSLFRAVETRRPLVRSTASGLTAYVDTAGRVRSSLPYYVEGYLVVDVKIPESRTTLYTLAGDWFPIALIALLILLPIGYYFLRKPAVD